MAQLITVRLNKSDQQPLGFRLQGGKDFGTPLVVQKVNGGSAAERAGLQAGDALIRVNNTDVYTLRHQEAQDTIRTAGQALELVVQRGGSTWRPAVTPTGSLPRPGSRPLGASPIPVTNTSLKANPQPTRNFGSGHNSVAKPFGYMNGSDSVKGIVNKQYNTPVNMYSDKTIAETLTAQAEVLAGGVMGVNFKKNEKTYDAEKSAVFKVLQEEENDPEPAVEMTTGATTPVSGLRHVSAPVTRPDAPINNTGGLPPGQNICEECERLITGVFVRIKDKNLHVECFKCSTCGSSLKNQGYYNINGKLYCDIHAKLVARQNPPAPNLEPVTVPPGGRIPTNTYSTPLPPIATNNYTNGSSSMFSPSSNLSGPKPFGSSVGSAYSPASLSPRSGPVSPARPVAAPAPAPAYAPAPAPAYAPAPAPAYAPAPTSAPYAPTKNVKSIVWPPPNPPEDEPPAQDTILKIAQNPVTPKQSADSALPRESTISKTSNSSSVQTVNNKLETAEQRLSSSQETTDISSNATFSSTSVSTSTATTAKSESSMENKQTQMLQGTTSCTLQSYSEQALSESKCISMQQSEKRPIQLESSIQSSQQVYKRSEESTSKMAIEQSSVVKQDDQCLQSKIIDLKENNIQNKEKIILSQENQTEINKKSDQVAKQKRDESNNKSISHFSDTNTNTPTKGADVKQSEINNNNATMMEINKNPNNHPTSNNNVTSLVDALTTAPDRPYSPLPNPVSTIKLPTVPGKIEEELKKVEVPKAEETEKHEMPCPPKLIFEQPKRPISPIPPIKTYNPPEKIDPPISLPPETTPYIPPDFKINVEKNAPPIEAFSLADAVATAPDRPFTPVRAVSIERGSLKEAVTVAPDRPYSPLTFGMNKDSISNPRSEIPTASNEILRPIATQISNQMTIEQCKQNYMEQFMETNSILQSSKETSAFKPIRQDLPLPVKMGGNSSCTKVTSKSKEEEYNFHQYSYGKQEITGAQSMEHYVTSTNNNLAPVYSSVKNAQSYFEQLDKKEVLTSTAVRSKSGLHRPESIPPYQQNFELLPSQRGITPELCTAPAIPQRPVTPTTNPPTKQREKSQEPKPNVPPTIAPAPMKPKVPQIKTPVENIPVHHKNKDNPITFTFQPVVNETTLRISPARSRPTTPSLINKPAPIIPYYQMNLVTTEQVPPETYVYKPNEEGSRTPTPKPRGRSPAPRALTPQSVSKVQAPRIKETQSQYYARPEQSVITQTQPSQQYLSNVNTSTNTQCKNQNQSSAVVNEQRRSNVGYQSESYQERDLKIKKDSIYNQNYGQRQSQSHNIAEYGNTTVQRTKKTFEEFERTQSAKVIEIRKGGSQSSSSYKQQIDSNIPPSIINPENNFPSTITNMGTPQQSHCFNTTNANVATSVTQSDIYQPSPSLSGANQGPVCDPTPSTGSGVGVAARGKNYGVSSAPKRGRGVLNKAALPGSRVPLCGSCNGNIRSKIVTNKNNSSENELRDDNNLKTQTDSSDSKFNTSVEKDGTNDVVVRRRDKKNKRNNDDGRRDSRIIARPLSTMTSTDVADGQYPVCHKCDKAITRGPFITALGRIWCPEHFICVNTTCRRPLQDIGFVEENGQLYCEFCFEQYIAPACDKCHAKIKGDCLNAIGKHFHPECFNCVYCGKMFGNNTFFLEDGLPYCEADWNELFTTKCFACGFPVEAGDRWVEALNNNYHSQCFNCTVCKKNLEGQSFFAKGGRPFCKAHAR